MMNINRSRIMRSIYIFFLYPKHYFLITIRTAVKSKWHNKYLSFSFLIVCLFLIVYKMSRYKKNLMEYVEN